MPIRHVGRLTKNAAICSRLSCVLPCSLMPWTWNTFFAKSMPTVAFFMVDALLGSSGCTNASTLAHRRCNGWGVHPIAHSVPLH